MESPFMKVCLLLILKKEEFYNLGKVISKSLMADNYITSKLILLYIMQINNNVFQMKFIIFITNNPLGKIKIIGSFYSIY